MDTQHLINTLNVKLKFTECSSNEKQIQKRSNQIYDKYIQPALDKLFDKYGEKNIIISHIEIDLGCINTEDIEQNVYNALEREFIDYLNNDNNESRNILINEEAEQISTTTPGTTTISKSRDKLIRYIKTNSRPWYITNEEFNLPEIIEDSKIDRDFLLSIIHSGILNFINLISITPLSVINEWIMTLEKDVDYTRSPDTTYSTTEESNLISSDIPKFIATYHLISMLYIKHKPMLFEGRAKDSVDGSEKKDSIEDFSPTKHLIHPFISNLNNDIQSIVAEQKTDCYTDEKIYYNSEHTVKPIIQDNNTQSYNEYQKNVIDKELLKEINSNKKGILKTKGQAVTNPSEDPYLSSLLTALDINTEAELEELKNKISLTKQEDIEKYTEILHKNLLDESERESQIIFKEKRIAVDNGGLVLCLPWLTTLFNNLHFLDNNQMFKSISHQERAVIILQYLTGTNEDNPCPVLFFNKIICGLPLLFPINLDIRLTEDEKTECKELLTNMIGYWPSIRGTSIKGVQETFIRREGIIQPDKDNWIIRIENKTVDILMQDIPWSYTVSSLPWNKYLIYTEWNI